MKALLIIFITIAAIYVCSVAKILTESDLMEEKMNLENTANNKDHE